MTDQTTPEPMADEETLPLAFSDQARRLLAEVDRLRAQLEEARQAAGSEHGRAAAFEAAHREARTRCDARDAEIDRLRAHRDQLHTETRRLGVSLAETIHERQQLRTQLAEAERDRTAALAVAADLTDERDSARAIATGAINDVDRLRARTTAAVLADTEPAYVGPDPAQEPVTATGAPDPDPSEGTAPTSRPGGTQRPHEPPCLDSPAPLTLDQAATALYDWAGDLDDGANTDWPAGHADVIRGIRAAADWLDARSAYETEARDTRAARPIGLIGDTDG